MVIDHSRIGEENQIRLAWHESDLAHAMDVVERTGVDAEAVVAEVARFSAAAPSWAVGTGGTRFGRFPGGGEPRDTFEKIDDVAALNALTGANRTVSLHVPWDDPGLGHGAAELRRHATARGVGFDAVRRAAIEHNHYVIDLGVELGSQALTVWLGDGMNHPGQASFRAQFERVVAGLGEIYAHVPDDWEMFTEHKPYE